MGPATRLKNAVIDKGAMWEPVQQVTECVAHVKCILEIIVALLSCQKELEKTFQFCSLFFSVSLGCGEKSVENNTYFQVT